MSQKNRKGAEYLDELRAYLDNRMSEGERNSFEKRMEADPFLREAVEGLSSDRKRLVNADIEDLESKIMDRTSVRKLPAWYRISAAVVLLLVVSSILLVRELREPAKIASGERIEGELNKQGTEPLVPSDRSEVAMEDLPVVTVDDPGKEAGEKIMDETLSQEKENIVAGQDMITGKGEKAVITEQDKTPITARETEATTVKKLDEKVEGLKVMEVAGKEDAMVVAEVMPQTRSKSAEKNAPVALLPPEKTGKSIIRGTVLSSDDTLPLPGTMIRVSGTTLGVVTDINGNFEIQADSTQKLVASFLGMQTRELVVTGNDLGKIILEPDLMSLDEVVVVGYGIEGKVAGVSTGAVTEVDLGKNSPVYIAAEPVGGMAQFREYVDQNMEFPVDYMVSDREVVRLKFTVSSSGEIFDFKIMKSPGEEFSNEAIRLIKDGPAWNPATGDGLPVEDTVMLRIVFRKN